MQSTTGVSELGFIKSQKMVLSKAEFDGAVVSTEELVSQHAVEALCSTEWALGFVSFHCAYMFGKPRPAAKSCQAIFKATLAFAGITTADALHMDMGTLPKCNLVSSSCGCCVHCKHVMENMVASHGNTWRDGSVVPFLIETFRYPECPALLRWRCETLTQLASSLDGFVLGNANGLACLAGMPVLVSPHIARRTTRVTRVNPDMAASKSQVGSRFVFEKVEQRDTAVARVGSC